MQITPEMRICSTQKGTESDRHNYDICNATNYESHAGVRSILLSVTAVENTN